MTPWTLLAQEVGQGLFFVTACPNEKKEQEKKAARS